MEIKGVKIGDVFGKQLGKGKISICEVIDFIERRSIKTGKIVDIECWAKSMDKKMVCGDSFEVAFSTVKLCKITNLNEFKFK